MAYDLSEVKHELKILIENIDRLIQYEDNTDISEEIRSRVQVSLLDAKQQLDMLEDEIDDGIYEKDAPMYYNDEDDIFDEEEDFSY